MKTIFSTLLLFSMIVLGCSEESDTAGGDMAITGKWQMTEKYVGTGAEDTRWEKVKGGEIYQFKMDSTFSSNATDCPEGEFRIKGDTLQLDFNCNYDTDPQYIQYYFEGRGLVFNPLGPPYCMEGCLYRYEKID